MTTVSDTSVDTTAADDFSDLNQLDPAPPAAAVRSRSPLIAYVGPVVTFIVFVALWEYMHRTGLRTFFDKPGRLLPSLATVVDKSFVNPQPNVRNQLLVSGLGWTTFAALVGLLITIVLGITLAVVLVFVGLKMVWPNDAFGGKFPISWSLGIITGTIALSTILSIMFPKKLDLSYFLRFNGPEFGKSLGESFNFYLLDNWPLQFYHSLTLGWTLDRSQRLSAGLSGVQDLIAVYRALAQRCDHPLHLGLTEAGMRAFIRLAPAQQEALLDAIDQITGAKSDYADLPPGTRAISLPDNSYNRASPFLKVFGRPEGASVCECERVQSASLAQSLHLMNAADVPATGLVQASAVTRRSTEPSLQDGYPITQSASSLTAHEAAPRRRSKRHLRAAVVGCGPE